MPSSPTFPPEIFFHVIEQTYCSVTLYSLSQTCSFLHNYAEKLLYAGYTLNYDEWNKEKHRAFLTTITTTPRLASLVQVYSIQGRFADLTSFSSLHHAALEALTSLKELIYNGQWVGDCINAIKGCAQLRCITFKNFTFHTFSQYKRIFRLIAEQQTLEKFCLQSDVMHFMAQRGEELIDGEFTPTEEAVYQIIKAESRRKQDARNATNESSRKLDGDRSKQAEVVNVVIPRCGEVSS